MIRKAHHLINRFAKEAIIVLIFRCTLSQCISAEVLKYKHPNFTLRFVIVRTSPLQRENRFKNNCFFFCNGQPFSLNESLIKCRFCVGIHCYSLIFRQNSITKKRLSGIYLVYDWYNFKTFINFSPEKSIARSISFHTKPLLSVSCLDDTPALLAS